MAAAAGDARVTKHRNNIGILRLILASMVIIGHAPEMVDGSRIREPLTQIWPLASLGSVAVSGFFLLSGYLITGSMLREQSILTYSKRRILRIIPGYVAAFVLTFYVLGHLLGFWIKPYIGYAIVNMLFLSTLR